MNYNNAVSVIKELREEWVDGILNQFTDLESKGLLRIELGDVVLVRDPISDKIRLMDGAKVVLKDQEYVQKLEEENKEMKDLLKALSGALESVQYKK